MKLILSFFIVSTTLLAQQPSTNASSHPGRKDDKQVLQQENFSSAIADILVGRIGEGLAGHDRKTLLSAFRTTPQ